MLDIVIVDDEPLARSRLKRLVLALGYDVSAEAQNAQEALALIAEQDPAIVLLDVEMPGETGLQVAEKIAQLETPPAVIFTTAYDQYALDAFSAFAVAYLLKPINQKKLQQALEKASSLNKAQLTAQAQHKPSDNADKHITIKSHRGVDLIALDSICCLLADSKYITLVASEGEFITDGTLKNFEQQYPNRFARIHRNALVSIVHIEGLQRLADGTYTVKLKQTEQQPVVSRRYVSKIKALLQSL